MSDLSLEWLIVFVDASLKAALVALIAAAGLALLRVRDSNLRHRVWTGVLCGMLLLPALTQIVPTLRLPFTINPEWFAVLNHTQDGPDLLADQPSRDEEHAAGERAPDRQAAPVDLEEATIDHGRAMPGRSDWPGAPGRWPGEFPGGSSRPVVSSDDGLASEPPAQPAAVAVTAIEPEPPISKGPAPAPSRTLARVILSQLPRIFWSIWIAGGLVLGLRLLAGFWMARILRRGAQPIGPAELAKASGDAEPQVPSRRSVPILASPLVRVPITLGVVRPQVLLPSDWIDWPAEKLHAVLTHERTHAERGDCALALLAEVNRCVYWFHPLAWWLRRRLASLAEAACDDAAIGSIGDRARYARHLLEVATTAGRHRGRLIAGAVSMARCSSVETRITAILDFTRPLSQRLTWGTALLLVGTIVPLIALAAALRPSSGLVDEPLPVAVAANENPPTVPETTSQETTAAPRIADSILGPENPVLSTEYSVLGTQSAAPDNSESRKSDPKPNPDPDVKNEDKSPALKTRTVRGRVVDLQGKPIAGVALHVPLLQQNRISRGDEDSPHAAQTKSDADGRFVVDVPDGQRLPLIAAHPGFAAELFDIPQQGEVAAAEIILRPEQLIHGRMIDSEGRAVSGARFFVGRRLTIRQPNSLDEFLEERKKPPRGQPVESRLLSISFIPQSYQVATSDAEGRFVIRGIAADGACEVTITADGFVKGTLVIANRQGLDPAPYNQPVGPLGRAPSRLVGPDFTHVGVPGMTLDGRATVDGEPAAGVIVRASANLTVAGITTTDADGRYRLPGLPRGSELRLSFGGPERQTDLLAHQVTVATTLEDTQKTVDVELKRGSVTAGTLLAGRVIDPLTGKGVPAFIRFVPLAGNEFVNQPRYKDLLRGGRDVRANAAGEFRVPVMPGPGAVVAQVNGTIEISGRRFSLFRDGFMSAEDKEKLKITDSALGKALLVAGGGMAPLSLTNAVKYVNLAEGAQADAVEITLDRGKTVELEIVDAEGQSVTDAGISGIDESPQAARLRESRTTIYAIDSESPRTIVVLHAQRGLAGTLTLTGAETSPVRMKLGKTAAIRGRAVDKSGEPLAEAGYDMFSEATSRLFELETAGRPQTKTDKDGRFRIENVIPGKPLNLRIRLEGKLLNATLTDEQQVLKPGENIDLGDIVFAPLNQQLPPQDQPATPEAAAVPKAAVSKLRTADSVLSPQAPVAEQAQSPKSSATADDVTFSYAGTVVDPNGKPVAGAKLHFCYFTREPIPDLLPLATTAADGTFRFSRRRSDFDKLAESGVAWRSASLVATADGFGFATGYSAFFETSGKLSTELSAIAPDWQKFTFQQSGPQPTVLKLAADDVPVRMRIVDIEGRAVAGAKLDVIEVWEAQDEALKAWERESVRPGAVADMRHEGWAHLINGPRAAVVASLARPDRNGWAQVNGLGRDRIAKVQFSGPGLESAVFHVRTRRGETIRLPRDAARSSGDEVYHPAEFTHVAGPSQPVAGTITAAKTGERLAGCIVQGDLTFSADRRGFFVFGNVTAKTDAEGAYRLDGLAPGDQRLVVLPPRGSALLPTAFSVKTGTNSAPATRDARLIAGVRLRGTITDSRSARPIAASLRYTPFSNNSAAQAAIGWEQVVLDPYYYSTDAQGRFELPALPGKGILTVTAHDQDSYPLSVGFKQAKAVVAAAGARAEFSGYANLVTVVDLAVESEISTLDLTLDPGRTVAGLVEGPDGQRIAGYLIYGASQSPFWRENQGEGFQVQSYFPDEKRRLMFYHPARNLVAVYELAGEPPETLKIVLEPGAVLKGRIVDKTGLVQEDVEVVNASDTMATPRATRPVDDPARGVLATRFDKLSAERTGTDGRFELRGIIPGLKYSAGAFGRSEDRPAYLGRVFTDVIAKSGEVKDLGDLHIERDSEKAAMPAKPESAAAAKTKDSKLATEDSVLSTQVPAAEQAQPAPAGGGDESITYRGRVVDPDGKPFAGARVCVLGWYGGIASGVKNIPASESKSRADGSLEIVFSQAKLERAAWGHSLIDPMATIAAFGEGFGPAWKPLAQLPTGQEITLRLVRDDIPVTGRVLDPEGRPIAGARVAVERILAPKQDDLSEFLKAIGAGEIRLQAIDRCLTYLPKLDDSRMPTATSDAQGRFRLTGIGRERFAELAITGPNIAYGESSVVTRPGAPLVMQEVEAIEHPSASKFARRLFGAEIDHVALPSRPVTGTVRDAETGKPLPGIRVLNWRFAGSNLSASIKIATVTDNAGQFRLTGMPVGEGNLIMIVPGADQPYFSRQGTVAVDAKLDPIPLDIGLHRGIWITGRVTDKVSGKPVSAVVDWFPYRSNEFAQKRTPEFALDGRREGWTNFHTVPDGTYRVVGLPGRAIIGASANSPHFDSYRRGVGAEKLEQAGMRGMRPPGMLPPTVWGQGPGGMRMLHSIKEIDVPEGADSFTCDLELDPGQTLRVAVVDPAGKPLSGFDVRGERQEFGRFEPTRIRESAFDLRTLSPGDKRFLFIHHAEQQLGKFVPLAFDPSAPRERTISLEPCATATGRIVAPEIDSKSESKVYVFALLNDAPASERRFSDRRPFGTCEIDSAGRFRLTGLIPGCKYFLAWYEVVNPTAFQTKQYTSEPFAIRPGETIDLGDVKLIADNRATGQSDGRNQPVSGVPKAAEKSAGKSPAATNDTQVTIPAKPEATGTAKTKRSKLSIEDSVLSTQVPAAEQAQPLKASVTADDVTFSCGGTVVDPNGKPVAGARLRLEYYRAMESTWKPTPAFAITSGADGRFRFSIPKSEFDTSSRDEPWNFVRIVATADGFGFDEVDVKSGQAGDVKLQLVQDVPINGRILTLEGTPVAGAVIRVRGVHWTPGTNLDGYVRSLREEQQNARFEKFAGSPNTIFESIRTDGNGRFQLRGMGAERLVEFYVEGPTIEHWWIDVLTRETPPVVENQELRNGRSKPDRAYGATFEHLAPPGRKIFGVVRDQATGKPLAGAVVRGLSSSSTKTDAAGRFELFGYAKSPQYDVSVAPTFGQPYFAASVKIADTPGLEPLETVISLSTGTLCRGQVTDKSTGRPVAGELEYFALYPNPAVNRLPIRGLGGRAWSTATVKPDGQFAIPVLPGPGVLAFRTSGSKQFEYAPACISTDEIDAFFGRKLARLNSDQHLQIALGGQAATGITQASYHGLALINPDEGAESIARDISVEPGRTLRGTVRGPDDQPLAGVTVYGLTPRPLRTAPLPTAEFEVLALGATQQRVLLFTHDEKKLGLVLTIRGGETEPLVVPLKPLATAVGRLLDEAGEPVRETILYVSNDRLLGPAGLGLSVKTDKDGRFRLEGLVPGLNYSLNSKRENGLIVQIVLLTVESGEVKELGELRLKPMRGNPAATSNQDKSDAAPLLKSGTTGGTKKSPAPSTGSAVTVTNEGDTLKIVRGRVTGPDGKPAAKADIAVIGVRIRPERGGDLGSRSDVLAEGVTDGDGRFEIRLSGVSSKSVSRAEIVARSDESGLAGRRIDPDARDLEVALRLPAEQVIRGRFIDIEGRPAGGVQMEINSIRPRAAEVRIEGFGYYDFASPPQAWPPIVTADQNGSFAIHGIPADNGVYLAVAGTDRFAPQGVTLNTGAPEQRPERDATYRSLVRNVKSGEELVLPLAPAQIFEGVVRFEDTGAPAPHARLTIFSSQQERGGSSFGLAGKADAQGRYRINSNPGVRFRITAYPPDGVPYLIRELPDLTHNDGSAVKEVDVSLPRGVLQRGRVVESGTTRPIAGALIQYVLEQSTRAKAPPDIVTGWQGIQLVREDGTFEIAVLRGPGTLLVNGGAGKFVAQEIGSRQLSSGLPGGERNYAHAFQRVDPEKDSDPPELTIELERGATVSGRITNSAGEPVDQALLITRLNMHPTELTWRGFPIEALGGRFELSGLAEGKEYPVHFLDAKRRLGATAMLTSKDTTPTVELVPCGDAVATFVDSDGKPNTDRQSNLEMVVTSGPHRMDLAALREGLLTADAAYVVNIDRTNYRPVPKTDAEGRVTFPALIPGGRYRITTYVQGKPMILKEFVAESGKTLELGKIVVAAQKEE